MSRNPSVVIRPTLAPVRSSTALVTSVVPWTMSFTWSAVVPLSASDRLIPSMTARLGSAGVVGSLQVWVRPRVSSCSTRSVKVPPTSTPIRAVLSIGLPSLPRAGVAAVVADRGGVRHGAFVEVGRDGGGVAPGGRPVAATAREGDRDRVPRPEDGHRLQGRAVAAVADGLRRVSGQTAVHPLGGMAGAVAEQRHPDRRPRGVVHGDVLAEAAAVGPRTAGVRAELLPTEEQQSAGLQRLDAAAARDGGERRGGEAVVPRARAHPGAGEQDQRERLLPYARCGAAGELDAQRRD